jgi:ribosome-binding ATPase YchF (GTP1/OBG family)
LFRISGFEFRISGPLRLGGYRPDAPGAAPRRLLSDRLGFAYGSLQLREDLQNPEALLLRAFADAGYISFLTVGGKENRAWPIRRGMTAWEAAGTIHTDIQKGFIRAEVISFADFVAAGGETQAKRAGKQRLELKPYLVQDYDLMNFRFNK